MPDVLLIGSNAQLRLVCQWSQLKRGQNDSNPGIHHWLDPGTGRSALVDGANCFHIAGRVGDHVLVCQGW